MFSAKFDELADYMIRPQRTTYLLATFGPKVFKARNGFC
jgi:hypothetical protein